MASLVEFMVEKGGGAKSHDISRGCIPVPLRFKQNTLHSNECYISQVDGTPGKVEYIMDSWHRLAYAVLVEMVLLPGLHPGIGMKA